jgi:hypothetical protein
MGALPDFVHVNERLVSGRRDERLNVVFWVFLILNRKIDAML